MYDYKCIMPKNCESKECFQKTTKFDKKHCFNKSTKKVNLPKESALQTDYLRHFYVKCPPGHVMKEFHLKNKIQEIYYDYSCCPAVTEKCTKMETRDSHFVDFGTVYLERQYVQVPDCSTQAIQGFQLIANYAKKEYKYHVDYCTVTG